MRYKEKIKIAKIVLGWAMYNDFTIKVSIDSLEKGNVISEKEIKWALKNIDRLVYLSDKFDEEMMYF